MGEPNALNPHPAEFERFLYASVGEDRNGYVVTATMKTPTIRRIIYLLAASSLLALTACQPTTANQRQANCAVGTAGGAALGAIAGRQVGQGTGQDIATVIGAAGGGLAGASTLCR